MERGRIALGIGKVSNGNRSKFEIMADILRQLHNPVGRTSLMCHCNMSSAQLDSYLTQMQSADLVCTHTAGRGATYKITEMGKEYLSLFNRIALLVGGWRKNEHNGYTDAAIHQNLVTAEKESGKHCSIMLFPLEKSDSYRNAKISSEFIAETEAETG